MNSLYQDLDAICSLAIYWNYQVSLEFLYEHLATPNASDSKNLLRSSLYVSLLLLQIAGTAKFFAIVHLAVVVLVRWLAGKSYLMVEHNWSPLSMGRVVDILYKKFEEIVNDPSLIHNKNHMMQRFDVLKGELPYFSKEIFFLKKNSLPKYALTMKKKLFLWCYL